MHKYKQPVMKWGFNFTNLSEIFLLKFSVGKGIYKLCILTVLLQTIRD